MDRWNGDIIYKVLDVREITLYERPRVVLICKNAELKRRRRIEVYPHNQKAYEQAQMFVSGDTIAVNECLGNISFSMVDEIECNMKGEKNE